MINVDEKLKRIIISFGKETDAGKINDDTDLIRDYSFNSVDLVQLVVEIEDGFDIEMDDEDLSPDNLKYYKNLKSIVSEKLKQ